MKEYNTRQKELILRFLREHNHDSYTASQLSTLLPDVGKSTLYRILSHLEAEGSLSCSLKGRSRIYSFRKGECVGHMHLLCKNCGHFIHLSKEATRKISLIIENDTGFSISEIESEMRGVCRECHK